jgi:hypothetical protein
MFRTFFEEQSQDESFSGDNEREKICILLQPSKNNYVPKAAKRLTK